MNSQTPHEKIPENLREEYSLGKLDISDLAPDPLEQFKRWFEQALNAKVPRPDAMSLATSGSDGKASQRIVLLKAYDEKGFVFYANYESAKAQQIEENPHASLLFFWPELERQVIIQGQVDKVSKEETQNYFKSRPRLSQIAANVSAQSQPIKDRATLDAKFQEFEAKLEGQDVPVPTHWGGYRVWPVWFEFWQGRENRLNDRLRYQRKSASDWTIERLQP